MMIARLSLLHSLPRLASIAPFLCLMVAQWEWPDWVALLARLWAPPLRAGGGREPPEKAPRGAHAPRSPASALSMVCGRLQLLQLLLDVLGTAVGLGTNAVLVQFQGLAPGVGSAAIVLQTEVDVTKMVPDHRVLGAIGQRRRLLQLLTRLLELAATEQHPAQAVHVGGVVAVAVDAQDLLAVALLFVQLQRLADHPLRLLQVLIPIGPQVAKVVVGVGVVGLLREDLLQLLLRLLLLASQRVDRRQREAHLFDRLLVLRLRLFLQQLLALRRRVVEALRLGQQ